MSSASALEREIRDQPRLLETCRDPRAEICADAGRLLTAAGVTHVVVAARGSSDNAARFGQYLWGPVLERGVYLATPSLYADGGGPRLDGAAVVGISQSGQSPDVVAVLAAAARHGRPTIAVTNDAASPLAGEATITIPLLVGAEAAVAATKTYTATLQALAQVAAAVEHAGSGTSEISDGLARLPELLGEVVETALARTDPVVDLAQAAGAAPSLTAVGRRTGFATAAETALKIREVARIRAEAYPVPDLLHGPIAANGPDSAAWVVASPTYSESYWAQVIDRLRAEGVRVTVIAPEAARIAGPDLVHRLPEDLPGWLFDLVAIGLGQVAALRLGQARGLDVDRLHGLTKVTLTR